MKKKPFKVQLDPEIEQALHALGARYQLSGNAVLAAAASELARIQPENLWHALGRIAIEEAPALTMPTRTARTREALPV